MCCVELVLIVEFEDSAQSMRKWSFDCGLSCLTLLILDCLFSTVKACSLADELCMLFSLLCLLCRGFRNDSCHSALKSVQWIKDIKDELIFFSLYPCCHVLFFRSVGSQKHKPLQVAAEVWKGVKKPVFLPSVYFPLPSHFHLWCRLSFFANLMVAYSPLRDTFYVTESKLVIPFLNLSAKYCKIY